jgi:hypothetical protein
LGSFTDKPVNYVNAPALARDKGIHVEEIISQSMGDYTNLIQIKLVGYDEELNEIYGTVFAKKYQRIVRLGQIYLDAIPEGSMLVIRNDDQPGVIGNIGTTLARYGINIARFHLGRREDRALCMVNIDTHADKRVIEEIRSLPHILSVHNIRLDRQSTEL